MGRKFLSSLLVSILLVGVFSTTVFAVTQDGDDNSTTTSDTSETTDSIEIETNRNKRFAEYKKEKAETLEAWQEARIEKRCEKAQTRIEKLRTRFTTAVSNRTEVYRGVVSRVEALVAKLDTTGVDTTELKAALEQLKTQADDLVEALNDYYTVLGDLVALKCSDDPQAFKSGLEVARTLREELHTKAKAFRQYAVGELKTILKDLKKELSMQADNVEANTDTETQ